MWSYFIFFAVNVYGWVKKKNFGRCRINLMSEYFGQENIFGEYKFIKIELL